MHLFSSVFAACYALVDSQGLPSLSGSHFLEVKGKRAVKPELWLVMSISHCMAIVALVLEYCS